MKERKTVTTLFMVPTLTVSKKKLKEHGYINGYIDDSEKIDKYKNCVFLLLLPSNLENFKIFLDEEYEKNYQIIEDYNYQNYVIIVYKLSEEYYNDFELVKKGAYSKTSNKFKELFGKTVHLVNELGKEVTYKSLQHQIFDKEESLLKYWENRLNVNLKELDNELWNTWEEHDEILNIYNFLKD